MAVYQEEQRETIDAPRAMRYLPKTPSPYHGLVHELCSGTSAGESAPIVGITSASRGSGVTTIAAKLGVSAAEIVTRPVLLIDCNANAPDLTASFGVPASRGVHEVVTGAQSLAECVSRTQIYNLGVLGPGVAPVGRGNADEAQGWNDLLAEARSHFGIVIVDLPPVPELLSEVTSLRGIGHLLLVVEAERTRRQAVIRAKNQLKRVGVELSGIVLNKRRKHIPGWIYRRV